MNSKRIGQLLIGWLTTVRSTALTLLGVTAAFVLMHLLGQGEVRELFYTLLLLAFGALALSIRSFLRYARVQLCLWDALDHLPPDAAALPEASNALLADYRTLAIAYQRARQDALAHAARQEHERLDYFTLWVHQIKTPIAALDLMAQDDAPPPRELMRQEVFKIGQYADAALAFQRLQSMHNDLALTEVPLYPLCCKLVKKLRPLFQYRRISLCMEPFDGSALTDAKWLGMAIGQVLTNALKYTPVGGRITIALAAPLNLTITDTGIGISAEDLPRVFERGFTGNAGRGGSDPNQSTGIGLYLCKQACDQLGHRVHIHCPQAGGTCVTFLLEREAYEAFS